jgi:hypothetical protein
MKRVGFYAKFNVEVYHHHGTSHQDSCGTRKAFSSPPGMCSFSWIITLCSYIAKRLVVFAPKFTEKSPFLNARLAHGVLSAVSFSLQTSTTMAIHAYGKDCLLF